MSDTITFVLPMHPNAGALRTLRCQHPEEECQQEDHEFTPRFGECVFCGLERPNRWDLNMMDYYGAFVTVGEFPTLEEAQAYAETFSTEATRWADYLLPTVGTKPATPRALLDYLNVLDAYDLL